MNPNRFLAVESGNNRAEYQYIHSGAPRSSTAFELTEKAEIILNIPRSLGTTEVFLEVYDESLSHMVFQSVGEWSGFAKEYDNYLFKIPTDMIGTGLYFMRPRLSVFGGFLFGQRWAGGVYFNRESRLVNMMQLSITDPVYKAPKTIYGSNR